MMMKSRVSGVLVLLLVPIFFGAVVLGDEADLLKTHYYLISIGSIETPIASLIQTSQGKGFAVIVRSGEDRSAYRGSEPTEESEASLLGADSLLYVDNGLFLLRVASEDLDYVVRPAGAGYGLVLIPHRDLPQWETLLSVLNALQEMGIVSEEVQMDWSGAFLKDAEKLPPPPPGVAIDSALYGLVVAADWFSYATAQGLTRVGLKVEVVAEKLPDAGALPESFVPYIVSETNELAKLLVPIHRLVDLAMSSAVGYVRPPYQPHPVTP